MPRLRAYADVKIRAPAARMIYAPPRAAALLRCAAALRRARRTRYAICARARFCRSGGVVLLAGEGSEWFPCRFTRIMTSVCLNCLNCLNWN